MLSRSLAAAGRPPADAAALALRQAPLLHYVAEAFAQSACARCLRLLGPEAPREACQACGAAVWCSAACRAASEADPLGHSRSACRCARLLRESNLDAEARDAARFLAVAYAAKRLRPDVFARFRGLEGGGPGGPAPDVPVELVHQLLRMVFYAEAPGLVAEGPGESAELLAKEALNAFALMAPNGPDGERRVKGGAVYAGLAMANHECFPNAARVDAPDGSLRMQLRALHALPAGSEILIGYFPLDWDFEDRQERLRGDYGFECRCPRCRLDLQFQLDSAYTGIAPSGKACSPCDASGEGGGEEVEATEGYLTMFLLKYLCPDETGDCGGTMVPVAGTEWYQCNVCDLRRTEADFLAEVKAL